MMKNSKKLLALVLVAMSCLSLVACVATPVASPEASKAPAAEETAAPAESAQAPAEESKGDVKLSIVMLGYNDTQIEAAQSKDGGPVGSDKYYMTNREKAEAAYPDVTFE